MHRSLLGMATLTLLLGGCGSNTTDTGSNLASPPVAATAVGTSTTTMVSRANGAQISVGNHTVTIPPGAISQDSQVTVTVQENGGGLKPRNHGFQVVGQGVDLKLGGAEFTGPVSVSLSSANQSNTELYEAIDGVLIPLPNSTVGQRTTAILGKSLNTDNLDIDPTDVTKGDPSVHPSSYQVVAVQGIFDRPAHVNWGSYNGYLYNPTSGNFEKFVSLGNHTTLPALGNRPCMVVHGLGSSISAQGFSPLAQYLLDQGIATSVVGFEYDTLDSVQTNGRYLHDFYTLLNGSQTGQQWRHVAHSMGTIVSRECFEAAGTLPVASTNPVVLVCGPHNGTPVIDKLQGSLTLSQRFLKYVVINNVLTFTNSDGTDCAVNVKTDQGFVDLSTTSAALAQLNQNAPNNHPAWNYTTIAGTARGLEYSVLDYFMGIYPEDGLVFQTSANFPIGQSTQTTIAENHSTAVTDPDVAFPKIAQYVR